jgi:hypothetical protein
MDASGLNVSKTPTETTNNLPDVFPMRNNIGLAVSFVLAKPTDTTISLIITPSCVVFEKVPENALYKLSCKSIFTIHSKHEMNHNYQIFHECLSREMKTFKELFYSLGLKGYHDPVFPIPTFDQLLPALEELFNPVAGVSLS